MAICEVSRKRWRFEKSRENEADIFATERYLQLLSTNKIKGTKFIQQNYLDKKEEEIDLAAKVHTSDRIAKLNTGRFSS